MIQTLKLKSPRVNARNWDRGWVSCGSWPPEPGCPACHPVLDLRHAIFIGKKKLKTIKEEEIDFQSKKLQDFNAEQADIISDRIIQKITKQFANHLKSTDVDAEDSLQFIQEVFQLEMKKHG